MNVSRVRSGNFHDISANATSHYFSSAIVANGTIYAATFGQGIIRSTAPLPSFADRHPQRLELTLSRPSRRRY